MSYGLSHRTYGSTKNCKGCRYWSEMIAGCNGGDAVQALCLAPKPAPCHGKYMSGSSTCPSWASGHLGAIDEPGEDPARYDDEAMQPLVQCPSEEAKHG